MRRISIVLAYSLLALISTAQVAEVKPFIEITGTAELEVDPDQIFIRISLQENTDRSKKNISEQEQDLIRALKSVGLSEDKLTVIDANAFYGKSGMLSKEVISSKNLELEVSNATEAKKAFEQLDKLNIKNAHIARVDHSEMDDLKRQAKVKAIRAAKEKATYLLGAIDENLGGALLVRENAYNVYGIQTMANYRGAGRMDGAGYESKKKEINLDFKKIKVSASIYVKWAIRP